MVSLCRSILLLACLALVSPGCGGSCDELAEVGCAHAGESSDSCAQLRQRSERVSRDDKRACAVALSLVENLEKVR